MESTPQCIEGIWIYDYKTFPYALVRGLDTVAKGRKKYVDAACAFDIETTTIEEPTPPFNRPWGFMYIWQFCIEGYVCIGRTWDEYKKFLDKLRVAISRPGFKLVVYSHNLQFEFQFMRNFFRITDVFCREKRDVVYCTSDSWIEYRCSYMLTNMSLKRFLDTTEGVTAFKLDGSEFNYRIRRYPDTVLSTNELLYCVHDVYGLVQAIRTRLKEYNLCDIPITSTGYVRRDFRERCLLEPGYKDRFLDIKLTKRTYQVCKQITRGAIAGSNSVNTGWIIDDVDSFDIKSSYPFQMMTKYYPQSRFIREKCKIDSDRFYRFINNKCCMLIWRMKEVRLKRWDSIPYISKDKCLWVDNTRSGNGKLYSADEILIGGTEIDFQIIMNKYECKEMELVELWVADRGPLSKTFREVLAEMFQKKTDLEDGDRYLYGKYKNKINAAYGMMLSEILHSEILYELSENPWKVIEVVDVNKALAKYYNGKQNFLSYQHGIWVLSHSRSELVDGMNIVGSDIVQVDTDSVKCVGDYKEAFENYNRSIIEQAESYDVKPYAIKNGNKHYLGVWEHEGDEGEYTYDKFVTLGAKKYACIHHGERHIEITVSGLAKSAGSWLEENGGLEAFTPGTTVPCGVSGRTDSVYNDITGTFKVTIDGHEVVVGSNIAVLDSTYTFGMTDEWLNMVMDTWDE